MYNKYRLNRLLSNGLVLNILTTLWPLNQIAKEIILIVPLSQLISTFSCPKLIKKILTSIKSYVQVLFKSIEKFF